MAIPCDLWICAPSDPTSSMTIVPARPGEDVHIFAIRFIAPEPPSWSPMSSSPHDSEPAPLAIPGPLSKPSTRTIGPPWSFDPAIMAWPPPPCISTLRATSRRPAAQLLRSGLRRAPAHRQMQPAPARFADATAVGDRNMFCQHHFHRTTVTVVPFPGSDWMANSFTRRLLPPSPRPIPDPW